MNRTVECPSGFAGRVRPLTAEHAGILADARAMRTGKAADHVLRACWVETTEIGPYRFTRDSVDWGSVLACDRIVALLEIRIATYGETEELEVRCPQCGHRFVWDLPLPKLARRALPDASRSAISAGKNRFETHVAGRAVAFRLMDGRDQLAALKSIQERGTDLVVASLEARVVDVEGAVQEFRNAWLKNLSMGDVQTLMDAMDDADGGVDTEFEIYCPACSWEWSLDLPLDLQRMFMPAKQNDRRRRRRSSTGSGSGSGAAETESSAKTNEPPAE